MSNSIFSRVYSYRERENKNSLENFFIEILAFCLEADELFFDKFCKEFEIEISKDYKVKTQEIYELGRPDILIEDYKTDILIECKIEHQERENQLADYAQTLLKNNKQNKYLIYLTKYFENKEFKNQDKIIFKPIRWADVFKLIDENNQQITLQFKELIKEQDMSNTKNFNYQDLSSFQTIASTISKMNEVLKGVQPFFTKKIGKYASSTKGSTLVDKCYQNYHEISKDGTYLYSVFVGFYWWDDDGETYLALRVHVPCKEKNKKADEVIKFFKEKNKEMDFEPYDDFVMFWHYRSVSEFIINKDEEQIPAMIEFLKQGINNFVKY